jgi:SAM-dependent methyltransferase
MTLRFHEISETNHRILNPFTEHKLIQLGEICRLKSGMRQLDLACGKGEMLCQWARKFGISGTGVDISQVFLEAARLRAAEFRISDQVEFIRKDAVQFLPRPDSYDVVSCIGANWIGGGTRGTLELVKGKGLRRSNQSLVLMGEIFWKKEPTVDALEALGVQPGDWAVGLDGLLSIFNTSGVRLVEMILASDNDWDRYESMHWWAVDRWCQENPDHPDMEKLVAFSEDCRLSYFRYERPLCDWGVFVLRQNL